MDPQISEARRLAQSDAGQQLFALLQRTDPAQLQKVMELAAAGDYTQMKNAMDSLLASQEAQELVEKLRR